MTNTDEQTGIVQADIAEFENDTLAADEIESSTNPVIPQNHSSKLPELEKAIRMQFTKTYNSYMQMPGSQMNTNCPPNPSEISPTVFNDLVYSLKIRCIDTTNSNRVFYESTEMKKIHVIPILRELYGDFFFTTDIAQKAELNENDPNEIANFNKIYKVIMLRDKIPALENLFKLSTLQHSYILPLNPYINLLRMIKGTNGFEIGLTGEEKEFLHGVFVEAEKDGKFSDMQNTDIIATLDALKGFLYNIQLKHFIGYAEKVQEKKIERYWNLLLELKKL